VLADIGGDVDVLPARDLVELLDHVLRLDDLGAAVVLEAVHGPPFLDLLPPGGQRVTVRLAPALAQELDHLAQDVAHRADDGDVDLDVLRDRGGVDVDVDDARVGAELLDIARDTVVEARPDGDEHVAGKPSRWANSVSSAAASSRITPPPV